MSHLQPGNMPPLPPGQQLAAPGKWPLVGEREPWEHHRPWYLTIQGSVQSTRCWSLAELQSRPHVERTIDIHCVTRWSRLAMNFRGLLVAELLGECQPASAGRFVSFVARSARSHSTSLLLAEAIAAETIVAFACDGRPIAAEHGGPMRIVVPGRYFYKSLKWLERIEILTQDRLGYWEAEAGYHNTADPWQEQRYIASSVSRQAIQELLAARDFSGRHLLSLELESHDLPDLVACNAILRNANFRRCNLQRAQFDGSNLTNARFACANLSGASLVRADLEGCDFTAADLRGADLRGSSLFGATFATSLDPAEPPRGAIIDQATLFDPESLAQLVPVQSQFLSKKRPPSPPTCN